MSCLFKGNSMKWVRILFLMDAFKINTLKQRVHPLDAVCVKTTHVYSPCVNINSVCYGYKNRTV